MTTPKKPDLNKPGFQVFPEAAKNITAGLCAGCKNPVGFFKDKLSEKEFSISGLCQLCQDQVFG